MHRITADADRRRQYKDNPEIEPVPQLGAVGASATIPNVAKTIVPSMISGHRYDDQPGHADIAAKSRSDSKDNTKLTVAIPAVSQTA